MKGQKLFTYMYSLQKMSVGKTTFTSGDQLIWICERFEPRSHFQSRLSLIVRVNVVLNRTVDSDWRFDNLCGSHLQSHSEDDYRTGCQDYVHPDDQTQPTFNLDLLSFFYLARIILRHSSFSLSKEKMFVFPVLALLSNWYQFDIGLPVFLVVIS